MPPGGATFGQRLSPNTEPLIPTRSEESLSRCGRGNYAALAAGVKGGQASGVEGKRSEPRMSSSENAWRQ